MEESIIKNRKSKERLANFIADPLIDKPKPRKLQQVYSILGSLNEFEVPKMV